MKRLLAALLCATMIIGPVGTSTVYATEVPAVTETIQAEADGEETQAEETTPGDVELGAEEGQEGKETTLEPESEETPGEGETDPAEDETPSDPDAPAEDEDLPVEDDEIPSEDAEVEEVAETDAELEEVVVEEAEDLLGRPVSDCFEVDADGTLILKLGASLPATAVIPAATKKIPAGIFTNNTYCTNVQFEDEDILLEEIAEGAFRGSGITGFVVPAGVTVIEEDTFNGASSLSSIRFDGVVTSIGKNAFSNTALTSITARNVTEVGDYAFSGCSSLTRVAMESLITIGDSAFSGCTSLDEMSLPSSVTSIGTSAFAGCALTKINLSQNAELELGDNCFQNNDKLTEVALPNCLEVVPQKAFKGAVMLTSVTLGTEGAGNAIRVISANAFENCSSLKSIVFFNVYDFKSKAFEGCGSLTAITIWNTDTESAYFSIAEDAFPNKSGVTIKGYNGKVEEYANRRGYKFETLYPVHEIKAKISPDNSAARVNLSVTKATKGTKVRVTVIPSEGYDLKDISISESVPIPRSEIILVENSDTQQVFEFKMANGDETVQVSMVKGSAVSGKLSYKFEAINGYTPEPVGDIRQFDISGRESQLVIKDKNGDTNSWYWNFSSSNSKVVAVSNTGVVRSVGTGNATITAALKSDSTKKISISVKVKEYVEIISVELDMPTSINRGKIVAPVIIDGEEIPVIQYEQAALAGGAKEFDIGIKAYAAGITPSLTVSSKWTTTDSKVAGVVSATSTNNKNTVKVKKGAVGETLITVSVLNKDEKTPKASNTKSFIVRVVDATPRLQNGTLTVDSRSLEGTALQIVNVYNYGIRGDNLTITTKKTDSKGVTTYPKCNELDVYFNSSDDTYYICSSNPSEPFAATYDNKLYLEGVLEGEDSSNDETFHIPITKLTVINKALNPTIKTTGKINLFYNTTADDDLIGKVTVTQSLKDIEVKSVELVSTANYKKAGSEDPDSFAANFIVTQKNNTTFEITRTPTDMVKVGGKNVTSGYLKIKYKGYASYTYKAITIPTCDTAPDYVLDKTSATASLYSADQEYELHLVDKKTKKIIQSLGTLDTSVVSGNVVGLGFTKDTTDRVFVNIKPGDVEVAKSTNTITLKVDGTPKKGKACIYVRMTTWSRQMVYAFSLNTTNTLPTVKFNSTTATLNRTYKTQAAVITATENQPEAKMKGISSIVYTGKKNADAAQKLIQSMRVTPAGEAISVEFSLQGYDIPKGTYSFKVTPTVTYDGTTEFSTKVQTIKIVVKETNPTIKFNSSTFKFNGTILDSKSTSYEEVVRTFKIGNLPTGVEGDIDDSIAAFTPVSGAPAFDTIADIDFYSGTAVATIKTNSTTIGSVGKTFKYTVSQLMVNTDSGDYAMIPNFTIAIQLDKKAPTAKVSAAGSINPIDESSKITYTATLSNISSEIDDVILWEKDGDKWYGGNKPEDRYSEHFEITMDSKKNNVAYLTMKPGKLLENGKKYSLTIVYTLTAAPGAEPLKANVTVTPKQKLPEITTDKTAVTVYAGQTNKTFTVTVKQKESKTMMDVEMTDVVFADGTSDAIKKAFRITDFDPDTGVTTVTLVNPSAVVQNSTYTLNFVTTYKNQATKSTGNKFSVKVTVKK